MGIRRLSGAFTIAAGGDAEVRSDGRLDAEAGSSCVRADAAMERYATGDDAAFSELYDELAPRLFAFAVRTVRNRARAEDLVQQTMLQMHCARGRFVKGARVLPWAFVILKRILTDQFRRKQVEVLVADPEHDPALERPSDGAGPEERAECLESERGVRDAIAGLPDAQRAVCELIYYADFTPSEAAEALGTTIAAVRLRLQRANETLRQARNDDRNEDRR